MFSISTLVDVVRIPPSLFGTTLKKAAINILKEKYESMINAELGYIIMILDAKVDEMGKMIAGDKQSYRYLVESIRKFPDQDRFSKLISLQGFENVKYRNLSFGIAAIHSGWKI